MEETDPANLQPKVRPLNQRVAEFIRSNRPTDGDGSRIDRALDILGAPRPMREEIMLRAWFSDTGSERNEKAQRLIAHILDSGLEPFQQPPLLPPIEVDDVQLICWISLM
jgi:hypothetical protein